MRHSERPDTDFLVRGGSTRICMLEKGVMRHCMTHLFSKPLIVHCRAALASYVVLCIIRAFLTRIRLKSEPLTEGRSNSFLSNRCVIYMCMLYSEPTA